MKVGYARVSSVGQDYETQVESLNKAGCEKVFAEKQSGKSADDREALQQALEFCREGDVLIVTKLDRLARSVADLNDIVKKLHDKGAGFRVLDQDGIDTTTATGKLLFNILGSLAEFERDLIKARCAEGIKKAKAKGVKMGRKPSITAETKEAMKADVKAGELSMAEIAEKYEVTRQTVYRLAGSKRAAA